MTSAQHTQEKKDRAMAAVITLIITGLILLFLILFKIITPLPPFPEMAGGGGGEELNFGIYNEGTGNVEGPGIGEVTSVVIENTSTPKTEESSAANENFENGEAVLEKSENPKIKNNVTVITPTKTKEDVKKKEEENSANNILNAYTHNKNKTGQTGGDGNSGNAGNEGSPDGNPNTDGKGGHGHGDGIDNGDGKGPGPGGNGVSLSGRKMLSPPPKVTDSKEEGVVVVVITVDKQGNVTDADPTGKGTNTSSAILKSKARQAALQAKFSASDKYDSQKGTIIFRFQF
jgi:outer membrane biosynthesis protein TonB